MKVITLSFVFVSCLLFSCKKNDGGGSGGNNAGLKINLTDLNTLGGELIVSEKGGKILLDTILPAHTAFQTNLATTEKLVDVTFVDTSNDSHYMNITTMKAVDPSGWTSTSILYTHRIQEALKPQEPAFDQSSILYTHVPSPLPDYLTSDYPVFNATATDLSTGNLGLSYTRHSNDRYLYLTFPSLGLYSFHIPKGPKDTVDLSKMDTTVKVNFTLPPDYYRPLLGLTLNGFTDAADLTKELKLFDNGGNWSDLQYPRTVIKKYEVTASCYGIKAIKQGNGIFYSYGDSMITSLPIPDLSTFDFPSILSNNFQIKWTGITPTYYYVRWTSDFSWTIYFPSDVTTHDAASFMSSLNIRRLKGKDFPTIYPSGYQFETITGFNYQEYTSYLHTPALYRTKRIERAVGFSTD